MAYIRKGRRPPAPKTYESSVPDQGQLSAGRVDPDTTVDQHRLDQLVRQEGGCHVPIRRGYKSLGEGSSQASNRLGSRR